MPRTLFGDSSDLPHFKFTMKLPTHRAGSQPQDHSRPSPRGGKSPLSWCLRVPTRLLDSLQCCSVSELAYLQSD